MLKYSLERDWYQTNVKTPIHYEQESIELDGIGFNWPIWAIEMVNSLGGTSEAIKTVSKLLENERKSIWQRQQLQS